MLKVKYQASESIKKKKKKKVIYGDDYNTKLPDEVIAERKKNYDDDSNKEEEEKDTNYDINMMEKINNLADVLKNRKSFKLQKDSVMKSEYDEEKAKGNNLVKDLISGLQNSINRNEKIMDLNKQMQKLIQHEKQSLNRKIMRYNAKQEVS